MKKIGFLTGVMLVTGIATTTQALPLSSTVKDGDSFFTAADNGAGFAINNHYLHTFSINLFATGLGSALLPWPATLKLGSGQVEGTAVSSFAVQDASFSISSLVASLSQNTLANWGSFNAPSDMFTVNGTVIGGLPSNNADHKSFNDMDRPLIDTTNPFRLTEVIPLDFGTTTGITNFDSSVKVANAPEPGKMMLLGAGFLGLAIYGKRRKNT